MIEEAEKNASADKSKKALISIIYEYDNLLTRTESILNSTAFQNSEKTRARYFFETVLEHLKYYYKQNKLKLLAKVVEENYLTMSFEGLLYDRLEAEFKLSKTKRNRNLIIDITDDDPE
jgi:molecular chaperone DnaK (HSP70)